MTARVRRERKLWHQAGAAEISMGCHTCADRRRCGGLKLIPAIFDCLDFCCHSPTTCDKVCPLALRFVDRIREVMGFETADLQPLPPIESDPFNLAVPMIYHASARIKPLSPNMAAVPLYRLFRSNGENTFRSGESLRAALLLHEDTVIVASGVAKDKEVERWWGLNLRGRLAAIQQLRRLDVAMVTTPNFSLFTDRPRWDDFHSMKRIAIVHHEMISEGMQAALHVNGRTDYDFLWWAQHITAHPEVTHIAYEFTTGTGWPSRILQHVDWLIALAKNVERPLTLTVRGGTHVLPLLAPHFRAITYVDTSSFRKAMARQTALIDRNGERKWKQSPLPKGAPVDDVLTHNIRITTDWLRRLTRAWDIAA